MEGCGKGKSNACHRDENSNSGKGWNNGDAYLCNCQQYVNSLLQCILELDGTGIVRYFFDP